MPSLELCVYTTAIVLLNKIQEREGQDLMEMSQVMVVYPKKIWLCSKL